MDLADEHYAPPVGVGRSEISVSAEVDEHSKMDGSVPLAVSRQVVEHRPAGERAVRLDGHEDHGDLV